MRLSSELEANDRAKRARIKADERDNSVSDVSDGSAPDAEDPSGIIQFVEQALRHQRQLTEELVGVLNDTSDKVCTILTALLERASRNRSSCTHCFQR